jgi:uncharacterized membrane protein
MERVEATMKVIETLFLFVFLFIFVWALLAISPFFDIVVAFFAAFLVCGIFGISVELAKKHL